MLSTRSTSRALVVVCGALLGVGVAAPALAHVEVDSDDASAGGYGAVVLTVPSESASARTTAISVRLPTERPFTSVMVRPKPGWRVTVREVRLPRPVEVEGARVSSAVVAVTWTATGPGLEPRQYDDFELTVGPLPAEGTRVTFATAQTYSDGSVVGWDEPTPASGAEPEHPAPVLTVGPAEDDSVATAGRDRSSISRAGAWVAGLAAVLVAGAALVGVRGGRTGHGQ